MKNKIIDNLNLSEQQQTFVEEIRHHLSSIEDDINFEEFSRFLNPDLINSNIHFTYEKDIFFEKDNVLINEFNSIYDRINSIKPVFIEEEQANFLNLSDEYNENFEYISKRIEEFRTTYINSHIEDYLIVQNQIIQEIDEEKDKEKSTSFESDYESHVNNLLASTTDEKTKEHLKRFIVDYQDNLESFSKYDSKISTINVLIIVVPSIILISLLAILLLFIFF